MPAGTNPDTDDMNRRLVLQGIAAALLCPPAAVDDLLAAGGCALLLRHAAPAVGRRARTDAPDGLLRIAGRVPQS